MKESFSIKFIKVLLIIIIFGCAAGLWKFGLIGLFAPEELSDDFTSIPLLLFTAGIYLIIAWNLTKIVFSIEETPFTLKNVKNFKIIGYIMVLLSLIDAVFYLKKPNDFKVIGFIFSNVSISIRPNCIFYLVLGVMALALAEIFKKAVMIKNENDLTI